VKSAAHELRVEQKLFWRSRELAFFTFALPIVFYVLLASVYGRKRTDTIAGVPGSDYLLAGMLGYGVVATAFAGLAISLTIRRESGILKRLRATPLPGVSYFGGVLGSTLVVYAIEAIVLVAIACLGFDAAFPPRLFSLVLALLLGAVAFAAMGIGLTTVIRSAEGSSAVVNAIYLPMLFISGAFFEQDKFPDFLQKIADILPLSHFISLVLDILFHGQQIWDQWGDVAVVAAWGAFGAVVAFRRFRWEPREG
jgi:ABC-2 type transport system permease protein